MLRRYSSVLVTGGAGFVGSRIVNRLLSDGFEVMHACSYANVSKARRVLGFNSKVSLIDDLPKLVEWYTLKRN